MKSRLILLIAVLLLVYLVIIRFRIKSMKGIPDISNKTVLDAIASQIVLQFVFVFLLVWSSVRFGIPENILKARWLDTVFMAAIVITYFTIRGILRRTFLPSKVVKREDSTDLKAT